MQVFKDSNSKKQKLHYEKIAHQYASRINEEGYSYYFNETKSAISDTLISYFGKNNLKNKTGIDVGCGIGDILGYVSGFCDTIFGTDIAINMCSVATKKHYTRSKTAFLSSSMDHLPFKDSSVDFVLSVHTFHHLREKEIVRCAIREFKRVVKSKGLIVIVDVNPINPISKLIQYQMVRRGVDTGDEKLVFPAVIKREFEALNIKLYNYYGYCFIPHFIPFLSPCNKFLKRTPFHVLGKDYITSGIVDK